MKVQITKYAFSVLLLASSAFFCHCTFDEPTTAPQRGGTGKELSRLEVMKAYYQKLAIMQSSSIEHNLVLDDFKVGYEVALQIKAPDTGLFALNLNGTGEDVVLHIVARYDWLGERNVLVLNTFQGGRWESEVRPNGFNFQPGINMTLDVVAKSGGFDVLQDNELIVTFPYRSGLPVDSVRRIGVISVDNQSAQNAHLTVRFA